LKTYNPSNKDKEIIKGIYDDFTYMRKLRNQKWKYFNDRSLKEYTDDNQLRLNGFVPDRSSQGKETWQSNVVHPVTRNKFKAILAAVALDVPQVKIVAQNESDYRDHTRAEVIKNLVKFSYDQDNKEEQIFFEAWEAAEKGTVIVYDGYLRATAKKKVITSYDPQTGDIEYEEKEVETDNQCVNFIVPLTNLYIKDWTVFDIQKQPSLCWVERMQVDEFKKEFGKYKNADYVKTSNELTDKNEADTFFKEFWQERDKDDEPIEVIRYFNKGEDQFTIVANGVLLHDSPLILGKKKKWYPFAKTIFEPFASDFFYGNSLPNTLMGEQDVINALFNMALDKTYKSMAPALLIGNTNKDDFDLEDQNTTIDTKIYVQDINQVKEMPIKGITESDIKMIDMISRGLDLSSVDSNQQGIPGRGVTAREVVIANENAKKLKGILYMFLTSLWRQKIKLRIMNILVYYTQPKVDKALGAKGNEYRMFMVENSELSDGSKGTLGIQMVGNQKQLPTPNELDIQEETYKMQGQKYEMIAITSDYLDDWTYDIKIVSDSIYQNEAGLTQTKMEEKLRVMGQYFPQLIATNQEKLAKDTIIAYEDDPDDYELAPPPPVLPEMGATPGEPGATPGAALATAGQTGMKPLPPL
jgi:hypothetical protein